MKPQNFNVRVYGLLIHQGRILISHEHWEGVQLIKFPGGGLEKGEGLADCLRREFMEELDLEVQLGDFFYVNDFLQISAFRPQDQLISLYYYVQVKEEDISRIGPIFNGTVLTSGEHYFEWVHMDSFSQVEFTFPIDQAVAQKLTSG